MPGSKALSPRQNEIAREYVRALLSARFKGDQTACAAALGIKQPTLNNFLSGERGTGPKMIAGIAKLDADAASSILAGRTVAPHETPLEVAPSARVVVDTSVLVLRDSAIEMLVRRGVGWRAAVRAVDGVRAFVGDEELAVEDWADLGQALVIADERRNRNMHAHSSPHSDAPAAAGIDQERSMQTSLDVKGETRKLSDRPVDRGSRKNASK